MPNTVKVLEGIAKEYLFQLTNEMGFLKGCDTRYSKEFAVQGAKIGNVVNVKKMKNQVVTRGPIAVIQPIVEETIPITILPTHQYQTAISINSLEEVLSIEDLCKNQQIKQAAAKMANDIEVDALDLTRFVYNIVGTPATLPGTAGGAGLAMSTAPQIFGNAGSVMTAMGVPRSDRSMILQPLAMGNSAAAFVGLQNPPQIIGEQWRTGRVTQAYNFDFVEDANVIAITNGTRTNGTMNGATLDGATTLNITGLGAAGTIRAGEKFTIVGVNAVNPMNQRATGFLQSFAVLADATANAGGAATVSISPTISVATAANVNGTVDSLPIAGAVVTFQGAANLVWVQNVAHHKDAYCLTTVDLPLRGGAEKCVRMTHEGISMRLWADGDIINDRFICRVDIVAVPTLLRPELACVVAG